MWLWPYLSITISEAFTHEEDENSIELEEQSHLLSAQIPDNGSRSSVGSCSNLLKINFQFKFIISDAYFWQYDQASEDLPLLDGLSGWSPKPRIKIQIISTNLKFMFN